MSDTFEVVGGKRLKGELVPQGAKNEALQILSAVLLTGDKVTISNVPNIRDVNQLIEILKNLGVKVEKKTEDTYIFQADNVDLDHLRSPSFKTKAG